MSGCENDFTAHTCDTRAPSAAPSNSPSVKPSASPSASPSATPTTLAPTDSPTEQRFPPSTIDWDFEGLYDGITGGVLDVNTEGPTPRGWTKKTGSDVAQVKDGSYQDPLSEFNGNEGQQYYLISGRVGANPQKYELHNGHVATNEFKLPLNIAKLVFLRLGSETSGSYLAVQRVNKSEVCRVTNVDGGSVDIFYQEECDLSSAAGEYVTIQVVGQGDTYAIDDLRFEDVNGDIFGNQQLSPDMKKDLVHEESTTCGIVPVAGSRNMFSCDETFGWVLPYAA